MVRSPTTMLSLHTSLKRFIKSFFFGRWKTNSLRGFRCMTCTDVEGIYRSSCFRFFKHHISVKAVVVLPLFLLITRLLFCKRACFLVHRCSRENLFILVDGDFVVHHDKGIASPQQILYYAVLSGCLHQTHHSPIYKIFFAYRWRMLNFGKT